jgi:tetratricopeptide (TPR) repeat protein
MNKTTHFILIFSFFLCLKTVAFGQVLRGHVSLYVPSGDSIAVSKTTFLLTNTVQKTYQKRLDLLNREWAIFSQTQDVSDIKLKKITEKKETLWKQHQFVLSQIPVLSEIASIDSQLIRDTMIKNMVSFLQEGKIEEASNIINEAQYEALKLKHLKSRRDTIRWSELCFLTHLKAQCAMMQFNPVQADFYFNESFGLYDPQEFLNVAFYDNYLQFLLAFDDSKQAFETIQTLLIKANSRQNTEGSSRSSREGMAYAYFRLQSFYARKKLYDFAQKAGENALAQFDKLISIEKNDKHSADRVRVMRQLALVYAEQSALPKAIDLGEKVLALPVDNQYITDNQALRLVLAQAYQKMYEQTGTDENRQKALSQLSVLQKEVAQSDTTAPSVKTAFQQLNNLKSYIEEINKPRFLAQKQAVWALEAGVKSCKTLPQTIYYRTQIIESLKKLNNSLPQKSPVLTAELGSQYHAQALAQSAQKNFKEVEANAQKALELDATDDNLKALLATAQWLQNKKPVAHQTYKTVKDNTLILKTINDFERIGIQKAVFEPIRVDFGSKKAEL